MTAWTSCTMCGHDPACGFATVVFQDQIGNRHEERLCHADDHSCYETWNRGNREPLTGWGKVQIV